MLIWTVVAIVSVLFFIFKKTSLPNLLVSSAITLICYVGVVVFVTLTFANSLREKSNQ